MITTLNVLLFILNAIEVAAVIAIVLVSLALAYYLFDENAKNAEVVEKTKPRHSVSENLRKEKLRRQKEETAAEGFFEESYVRGFDVTGAIYHRGAKVPTAKALAYYRTMDELVDTQIFLNTEEL